MKDDILRPICVINEISKLFGSQIKTMGDKVGFNPTYRPILFNLSREDGKTQLELARLCYLSTPTISLTLQKMENEGLIRRVSDTADARQMRVYLTEVGRTLDNNMRGIINNIDIHALDGFTLEEKELFMKMLEKVKINALEVKDYENDI